MSSPFGDQIEQAMAEFEQQRVKLLQARKELEKTQVSVSSKDHLVTVIAAPTGEIKEIKFNRTDYAAMAPAELSAVLVETLNKARTQAAVKAQAAFASFSGFGTGLRDSLAGNSELEELFGELLEPEKAAPAASVRFVGDDDVDG